jgi:hypothetical protein
VIAEASHTALTLYDLWHPLLNGPGYNFWSGIASDAGELTLIGGALALAKHANCDAPRCLRYGPHRTADGQHKLCRYHHPDLPNHRLSLHEIHVRHRGTSPVVPVEVVKDVETRAGWSEKELRDVVAHDGMRIVDGPFTRELPEVFSNAVRTQHYAYVTHK